MSTFVLNIDSVSAKIILAVSSFMRIPQALIVFPAALSSSMATQKLGIHLDQEAQQMCPGIGLWGEQSNTRKRQSIPFDN